MRIASPLRPSSKATQPAASSLRNQGLATDITTPRGGGFELAPDYKHRGAAVCGALPLKYSASVPKKAPRNRRVLEYALLHRMTWWFAVSSRRRVAHRLTV